MEEYPSGLRGWDKGDGEFYFRKLKGLVWLSPGVNVQTFFSRQRFCLGQEMHHEELTNSECPSN